MLPPELERDIFELAASLHPECIPALLLTAQRVKIWIEPFLYRVLRVLPDDGPPLQQFLRSRLTPVRQMLKSREPTFFNAHVKHVSFLDCPSREEEHVLEILSICNATIDIALPLQMPDRTSALLPVLGKLPLQRLFCFVEQLFKAGGYSAVDFSHSLFTDITHLNLMDWDGEESALYDLSQVPCLTHLAFHDKRVGNSICAHTLAHCKLLEVLVNVCTSNNALYLYGILRAKIANDSRFVMLLVADMRGDWEIGARGGTDFWARADMIVQERRVGQLEKQS